MDIFWKLCVDVHGTYNDFDSLLFTFIDVYYIYLYLPIIIVNLGFPPDRFSISSNSIWIELVAWPFLPRAYVWYAFVSHDRSLPRYFALPK